MCRSEIYNVVGEKTIVWNDDPDYPTFIRIEVDPDSTTDTSARITVTGPDTYWFGFGFGAKTMSQTYAFIINGGSTTGSSNVLEFNLGDHQSGTALEATISVESDNIVDGTRTTVFYRSRVGAYIPDYYSFPTTAKDIDIIAAYGTTENYFIASTLMQEYEATTMSMEVV